MNIVSATLINKIVDLHVTLKFHFTAMQSMLDMLILFPVMNIITLKHLNNVFLLDAKEQGCRYWPYYIIISPHSACTCTTS